MKNYMELLRRAKIFRGMEEKNILSMLDCLAAVKKRFTRGEFLSLIHIYFPHVSEPVAPRKRRVSRNVDV